MKTAILSSTRQSGAKGKWRVSSWSWWALSNTREKLSYFFTCCYDFTHSWKYLYNIALCTIILFFISRLLPIVELHSSDISTQHSGTVIFSVSLHKITIFSLILLPIVIEFPLRPLSPLICYCYLSWYHRVTGWVWSYKVQILATDVVEGILQSLKH